MTRIYFEVKKGVGVCLTVRDGCNTVVPLLTIPSLPTDVQGQVYQIIFNFSFYVIRFLTSFFSFFFLWDLCPDLRL